MDYTETPRKEDEQPFKNLSIFSAALTPQKITSGGVEKEYNPCQI